MATSKTLYDQLYVSPNAPHDVIEAAFTALTRKLHPDLNPGNEAAARELALVNDAYLVLSEPLLREEYDRDLREALRNNWKASVATSAPTPEAGASSHIDRHWKSYVGAIVLAGVTVVALARSWSQPSDDFAPVTEFSTPAPAAAPARPLAPNGKPWPSTASYLEGTPVVRNDGASVVVVDNSQNSADVFVKLVSGDPQQAGVVRQFYVPAFSRFTLERVTAGIYDLRFRDLRSGALLRSAPFELAETLGADQAIEASRFTMLLQSAGGTYSETYPLAEQDF